MRWSPLKTTERSEASIEKSACDRAFRTLGVRSIKLNGPGRRGNPDRLFYWRGRGLAFIEFKRPGEESTPLQAYTQKQIADCGFPVYECDSVEGALEVLRRERARVVCRDEEGCR